MRLFGLSIFSLFILFSCTTEEEKKPEVEWSNKRSIELSKELTIQEEIDVKLFLEMHKDWKMTNTGSGLQYMIYEHGKIDTAYSPLPGNIARIEYKITMLDGTLCYRTEDDEYENFKVDRSEIE